MLSSTSVQRIGFTFLRSEVSAKLLVLNVHGVCWKGAIRERSDGGWCRRFGISDRRLHKQFIDFLPDNGIKLMVEDCCGEGYDASYVELAAADCEVESGQIAE